MKSPTKQDLFILDIDSTLVTTHQRNQAILDNFVKEFKELHPEDCEQIAQAQCEFGDYGIETSLKRIDFNPSEQGLHQKLMQFWRDHFFTNEYLKVDLPTNGAVEWVQAIDSQNIPFIYLTARHKVSMWEGTLESLNQLGFPINEEILFLKDDLSKKDEEYKSHLIANIIKKNSDKTIWLIDNEPVVLNQIKNDHPQVNLVWFDSVHSGKQQPPQNVTTINSFVF